jgi:hypothetical protein
VQHAHARTAAPRPELPAMALTPGVFLIKSLVRRGCDPPTRHPALFFLIFFFSTFLGVSRQGEFKNTIKMFLQKVHVENFSQKNRQKFRCKFFLEFFVLSRFRVFLSDESSKTLQKRFATKIVSKSFYKKFDQKSKTDFFSICFITFLGVSR